MSQFRILPLLALAALAACRDEPSVAERFNSLAAEVENKGREYEAGAENLVREQEQRYSNEAEALFRQNENALGNAAEVEVELNAR
jgi:hypothetical protein